MNRAPTWADDDVLHPALAPWRRCRSCWPCGCPDPVGCPIQASPGSCRPSLDPARRLEPPRPAASRHPQSRCSPGPSAESLQLLGVLTQSQPLPASQMPSHTNVAASPHTAAQCNSQPHSSSTQPRWCPRCSPHMPSHLLQPRSLQLLSSCPRCRPPSSSHTAPAQTLFRGQARWRGDDVRGVGTTTWGARRTRRRRDDGTTTTTHSGGE